MLVFSQILTLLQYIVNKICEQLIIFVEVKWGSTICHINSLKVNQWVLGFFRIVRLIKEMINGLLVDLFGVVKFDQLLQSLIMEFCTVEPGVMSTQWKQEKKAQYQNNNCSCGFIGQNFGDLRFLRNVRHSLIIRIATIIVFFFVHIDRAGLIFVVGLSHGVNFLGSMIGVFLSILDCLIKDLVTFFSLL